MTSPKADRVERDLETGEIDPHDAARLLRGFMVRADSAVEDGR